MSPTPKQMGARIKRLREAQDLSRAELAERAGITREYVRRLEAGGQDPTLGVLQKIARALGVKLEELVK
jgi:transcriptional regulator with XRE-family HTH domain